MSKILKVHKSSTRRTLLLFPDTNEETGPWRLSGIFLFTWLRSAAVFSIDTKYSGFRNQAWKLYGSLTVSGLKIHLHS